jgi:hypothetical protein
MRFRVIAVGSAVFGLVLCGCGAPPPCVLIPKQLELARIARDSVRDNVTQKQSEVATSSKNLELSAERLQQMQKEQEELQKSLSQQAADSVAAGRKK